MASSSKNMALADGWTKEKALMWYNFYKRESILNPLSVRQISKSSHVLKTAKNKGVKVTGEVLKNYRVKVKIDLNSMSGNPTAFRRSEMFAELYKILTKGKYPKTYKPIY